NSLPCVTAQPASVSIEGEGVWFVPERHAVGQARSDLVDRNAGQEPDVARRGAAGQRDARLRFGLIVICRYVCVCISHLLQIEAIASRRASEASISICVSDRVAATPAGEVPRGHRL